MTNESARVLTRILAKLSLTLLGGSALVIAKTFGLGVTTDFMIGVVLTCLLLAVDALTREEKSSQRSK